LNRLGHEIVVAIHTRGRPAGIREAHRSDQWDCHFRCLVRSARRR